MKAVRFIVSLLITFNFINIKVAPGQVPASGTKEDRLTIGNVGIGTANPIEKLHLEGGNFLMRSTNPFIFMDNNNPNGTVGFAFQYNQQWKGWLYYNEDLDHLLINAETGSGYRPDLVIKSNGMLGIGTFNPAAKLHVVGPLPGYTGIFGTHIAPWSNGHNVSVGNTGEDAAFYVGQGGGYTGYLWWDYNETPANASFRIGTYNGLNPIYMQPYGGRVKVGSPAVPPWSLFEVFLNDNHYSRLGFTSDSCNFFYHAEASADGDGQACVYAYRTHIDQNDGIGYSKYNSNSALMGYNYWGDIYSFGTTGFNDNDYTRCGGVLGAQTGGGYWGSLGYEDSGGNYFGGYFTSTPGTGGGKSRSTALIGVGIGAWGDLMGADIHGSIYGLYAEGEHYALFTNGNVYKNGLDVHMQQNSQGGNSILYTSVSTAVTIQTCGTAMLSAGSSSIFFDPAFTAAISPVEPVVVTVTPVGNSNGVYLSSVTMEGFTVAENNGGRSNVMVNYIAVGKRAGYENPQLPQEIIDPGYVDMMKRGLHDDGDVRTKGEGLYYENGQLIVGVHPSTLPDPDKPQESKVNPQPVSPLEQNTAGYSKAPGSE